jgi:transcription factor IIIB subunit 2
VRQFQPSWLPSAAPLKNIHKQGWNLAGQHKEARDRGNAIAMSIFITSVMTKLKNPGLSPRAEAIFTQAMTKGKYRWGRKAKLAAGASMAIALREAHKSDSLRDIAFLLDDSPLSLSRAFVAVVSLLDFDLSSSDPVVHLPILLSHLQSLLHPESSTSHLPPDLVTILTPLSSHAVLRTATSLSGIISREACNIPVLQSPTPPIACAMLILALEAETRSPLPHLSELANALASRFGFARGVVTSRYKASYDLIEEWIREVPWLDQFVYKGKGHGASARSKVPKRSIVAKGIIDVIQFQEEIWTKKMSALGKASVVIEADPADEDGKNDEEAFFSETSPISEPPALRHHQPRKKRKIKDHSVEDAYHFLLNPLSAKSYTLLSPMVSEDSGASTTRSDTSSLFLTPPTVPFTTHLLSTPSYDSKHSPSRLQLLALSRGGGSAEHVRDDELFVEGELEELIRNSEEQEALKPLFRLQWQEEDDTVAHHTDHGSQTVRMEVSRGSGRVDMAALARILDGEDVVDDEECELESGLLALATPRHNQSDAAEEVSAWRPLSPGNAFPKHCTSVDRYEEEY